MLLDRSPKGQNFSRYSWEELESFPSVYVVTEGMEVAIGKKIAGKEGQSDKHMEGNNNSYLCVHGLLFFLCSCIPFRPDLQITELSQEWE